MKKEMGLVGWTKIYEAVRKGEKFLPGNVLFDHHNVITLFGLTRSAQLLGGLNTHFINAMAIGDGGAPQAMPGAPYVPLDTDTGLAHEILRTTSLNPTIVGTSQLQFTGLFLTSSPITWLGTLHAVNEVGLFFSDDVQPGTPRMFARNTFPSIPFDPVDREGLIVTWSVYIV